MSFKQYFDVIWEKALAWYSSVYKIIFINNKNTQAIMVGKKDTLKPAPFGLALAIVLSVITTIFEAFGNVGMYYGHMMGQGYMNYQFGATWYILAIFQAFIFGFITGYALIWVYNKLARKV